MCGIAGIASFKKDTFRHDLESMLQKIKHRGPDYSEIYSNDSCYLGHNRLKIIDLSDSANQPMHSHNNRYVIVYNGEIYNYSAIGTELTTYNNTKFKTHSDTEIILELFNKESIDFLSKLNGMFSLAIYDKELNELYLAVDRIGIKPLYYIQSDNYFAFSSELKSLITIHDLSPEINHQAVNYFLHLGYIPSPYTIYKNIHKLKPGNFLHLKNGKLTQKNYWNVSSKLKEEVITNEKKAKKELGDLLNSSVNYRLQSDVPYGTFLSGGIDSSLVTAKASELTADKLNTFTIGFKENKYNESYFAKAVAKHLNTEHHEFTATYKDALELVDSIVTTYDEPYGDTSCLPTLLVSKLASKYVKVVLTGEGGDELFHGYGSYRWAKRLSNPLISGFRKPASYALNKLDSRYKRVAKLLNYNSSDYLPSHIFSQEQYLFTSDELKQLLINHKAGNVYSYCNKPANFSNYINQYLKQRNLSNVEIQALFDLHYYLPGDLLTKIDRATMQYSIEGRVPILDHRIIEFAINLDEGLKYKNGQTKYLLKQLLYSYVPEKLFNRPKQGFSIPLSMWLKNELAFLISDFLNEKAIEETGLFNKIYVKNLLHKFLSSNSYNYLYNRIWMLIVMQMWYKKIYANI